jgi:hypothetical protein
MEGTASIAYEGVNLDIHVFSDGDCIYGLDILFSMDINSIEAHFVQNELKQRMNLSCTLKLSGVYTIVNTKQKLFKTYTNITDMCDLFDLVPLAMTSKPYMHVGGNITEEALKINFLNYIQEHCMISEW